MGLKAVVTKLDDVDEAYRDQYKENKDPKGNVVYCLDIEGDTNAFHPWLRPLKDEVGRRRKTNDDLTKEIEPLRALAALGSIDEITAKLDKFPELEAAAAGKLDEKKLNELVEGRLRTKLVPLERERDQWKAKAGDLEKVNGELTTKERTRIIRDALGRAAGELKIVESARDDVLMYAGAFEVQEDGVTVVTRDGAGFSPGLTAKSWLEDMIPKRTHWVGPTVGGGAPGSRGGAFTGANPWAHDTWSLTEQGAILKGKGREYADKLAKQAGTTVGGRRPEPPKK